MQCFIVRRFKNKEEKIFKNGKQEMLDYVDKEGKGRRSGVKFCEQNFLHCLMIKIRTIKTCRECECSQNSL